MKLLYAVLSISLALNLGVGAVYVKQMMEKEGKVEDNSAYMLPKVLEMREYERIVRKEKMVSLEVVETNESESANGFAVVLKTDEGEYSFTCEDIECGKISVDGIE